MHNKLSCRWNIVVVHHSCLQGFKLTITSHFKGEVITSALSPSKIKKNTTQKPFDAHGINPTSGWFWNASRSDSEAGIYHLGSRSEPTKFLFKLKIRTRDHRACLHRVVMLTTHHSYRTQNKSKLHRCKTLWVFWRLNVSSVTCIVLGTREGTAGSK